MSSSPALPAAASTVVDSILFRDAFGTPTMRQVFADRSLIARYIEVEVALARAQARCGGSSPPFPGGPGHRVSVNTGSPLVALCLAAAGFIGVQPLFWAFPTNYLGGAAAAGGIALSNSLGGLGGFVAPNVKTWAEHSLSSPAAGLNLLAATTIFGALLFLALRKQPVPASALEPAAS